jgi:ParB family chromosome partitioning protein
LWPGIPLWSEPERTVGKDVGNNQITETGVETTARTKGRIEYVPYWRLCPSPLNVRQKPPTGIEALAETIDAQGVLQNLVAHEIKGRTKMPKLGVCAGKRREAALDLLVSQGRIAKDEPVPVLIVSEGEALAISLIENREREDMHVADECIAFRLLMEEGKSVAHIAARFSIPEVAVRRALKIANLAPALLELLRDDKLDYEQAKALVLADDHETQERVWGNAVNDWQRRPSELRAAITNAEIDVRKNALAKFVGLDAYEAAGGYVRRDLFSDDQHAGYIENVELLHRLASDRLIELSQTVAREGWGWIETRTRYDATETLRYGRLHSTTRKPKKEEKAELAALTAAREEAQAALDAYYDDEGTEADEALEDRLIEAANFATEAADRYSERFETFDPVEMKEAGAFVYIDTDGQVCVERGLVRPKAIVGAAEGARPVADARRAAPAPKERPLHGEKLCKRLTAHRTAAIQCELVRQPNAALAVLMARMIPVVFEEVYRRQYKDDAVRIELKTSHDALLSNADDMADSIAWKSLEADRQQLIRMLPKRVDELLAWLLQQDSDVMSHLFAFCVASTVDGISGTDTPHPVNEVANLLEVDMSRYWKPTRASYFDHVSKQRIADLMATTVSAQAGAILAGLNKQDAASRAESQMAESGWLPEVLLRRDVPEHRIYAVFDETDRDVEGGDDVDAENDASADARLDLPFGENSEDAEAA